MFFYCDDCLASVFLIISLIKIKHICICKDMSQRADCSSMFSYFQVSTLTHAQLYHSADNFWNLQLIKIK